MVESETRPAGVSNDVLRILVTSDLHYGVSAAGDGATEVLARAVCASDADVLLLGGDIATGGGTLRACLELFAGFRGVRLAVPGNHDIWLRDDDTRDSWALHEQALPAELRAAGFHPLHVEPVVVGEVAFVGSMGWYDYSFRDDIGIELEWYQRKTWPGSPIPAWNDARLARFPMTDEALTAQLAERLALHLQAVRGARSIVGLIHHLPTRKLLIRPRFLVPRRWRFLNAFLGAERFCETIEAAGRVAQVFSGHVHMARSCRVGGVRYATVGGDYSVKQLVHATPERLVQRVTYSAGGSDPQ